MEISHRNTVPNNGFTKEQNLYPYVDSFRLKIIFVTQPYEE
jgi:hypothetical protein